MGKGINSNIYACAITPAWTFAFVVVVVVTGVGANLKASTEQVRERWRISLSPNVPRANGPKDQRTISLSQIVQIIV